MSGQNLLKTHHCAPCSIIDLEKNLLGKGINNFKTKGHLKHFLKKRPESFGMTDTHVWSKLKCNQIPKMKQTKLKKEKNEQKNETKTEAAKKNEKPDSRSEKCLHPFEKEILALIGTSPCSIVDLQKMLFDKGINNFKSKDTLKRFLNNRPESFGRTDTLVWSKLKCNQIPKMKQTELNKEKNETKTEAAKKIEKTDSKSEKCLHPLEKEILALIGKSPCSIIDLEKTLLEKGIKDFKPKEHVNNFLKKRPELFVMTDTHVWSKLKCNQIPKMKQTELNKEKNEQKCETKAEDAKKTEKPENRSEKCYSNAENNVIASFNELESKIFDLLCTHFPSLYLTTTQLRNVLQEKHGILFSDEKLFQSVLSQRPDLFTIRDYSKYGGKTFVNANSFTLPNRSTLKNSSNQVVESEQVEFKEPKKKSQEIHLNTKENLPLCDTILEVKKLLSVIKKGIQHARRFSLIHGNQGVLFEISCIWSRLPMNLETSFDLVYECLKQDPDLEWHKSYVELKENLTTSPHPDKIARLIVDQLLMNSVRFSIFFEKL